MVDKPWFVSKLWTNPLHSANKRLFCPQFVHTEIIFVHNLSSFAWTNCGQTVFVHNLHSILTVPM